MRKSIFISHQSSEGEVAEMVRDFLVSTGIPNDQVFCTSVAGNDVKERISHEVKEQLQESILIILILSRNYYNSAYCLNEAGIAWYLYPDVKSIAICLPEIDEKNMSGFFNSDNIIRRLSSATDISAIYDIVRKHLNISNADHGVVTREQEKLTDRYNRFLESRQKVNLKLLSQPQADIKKNYYFSSDINGVYPGTVPIEVAFLLVYAAKGNGYIIIADSGYGQISVMASDKQMNKNNTKKEYLLWLDALVILAEFGWVRKCIGTDNTYELTKAGYENVDSMRGGTGMNPNNDPLEEIVRYR